MLVFTRKTIDNVAYAYVVRSETTCMVRPSAVLIALVYNQ